MSGRSKALVPLLGIAAVASAGTVLFVYYRRRRAKETSDDGDVDDIPDMSDHLQQQQDQSGAFLTSPKGLLISDNNDSKKESEKEESGSEKSQPAENPIAKMWQNLTKPKEEGKGEEAEKSLEEKVNEEENKEKADPRRNFWGFAVPVGPDKPNSDKSLDDKNARATAVKDVEEKKEEGDPKKTFWGFSRPKTPTQTDAEKYDTVVDIKGKEKVNSASPEASTKPRSFFGLGDPVGKSKPSQDDESSNKTDATSSLTPPASPVKRRGLFGFGGPSIDERDKAPPKAHAESAPEEQDRKEEVVESHTKRQSFFGAFFQPPPPSPTKSPPFPLQK